jgi:hypothetical protein
VTASLSHGISTSEGQLSPPNGQDLTSMRSSSTGSNNGGTSYYIYCHVPTFYSVPSVLVLLWCCTHVYGIVHCTVTCTDVYAEPACEWVLSTDSSNNDDLEWRGPLATLPSKANENWLPIWFYLCLVSPESPDSPWLTLAHTNDHNPLIQQCNMHWSDAGGCEPRKSHQNRSPVAQWGVNCMWKYMIDCQPWP